MDLDPTGRSAFSRVRRIRSRSLGMPRTILVLLALLLVTACGRKATPTPVTSGDGPSRSSDASNSPYDYSPNRAPIVQKPEVVERIWVVAEETYLCSRRRDMDLYASGEMESNTADSRRDRGHNFLLAVGTELREDTTKPKVELGGITWLKVDVLTGDAANERGNVDMRRIRPR